jgi:hypothetical protein
MCLSSPVALAAEAGSQGVETKSGASNQPSVKDGAGKTSSSNSMGQVMSFLTGGMFIAQGYTDITAGYSTTPVGAGLIAKGVFEVALGILSMAQGGAHGSSAGQAAGTAIQTDGFGMDPGAGNLDPMDPRNPNSPLNKDPAVRAAYGNLAKLEKAGILDMKKGTIKAGDKTYKISDFSSAGAMAAAGIPKGAIDGMMSYADSIGKKAAAKMENLKLGSMTASTGYEDGGGSGGGSASSGDDNYASSGLAGAGAGAGVGLGRDPSSLAGMQKNYNGEPIGVAADSIFLMMNRRYKVKESQESFFTDAELALQK